MGEFKVNEYITLKLEDGRTNIYVGGKPFIQCKYILMRKTAYELEDLLKDLKSVDEIVDYTNSLKKVKHEVVNIPDETKFFVHCSNMQLWAENNYDTRFLHSNLAFPLLKKLSNPEINDPKAKRAFKDEIAKRFQSGYPSVIEFLIRKRYLDYLNAEEIDTLFEGLDLELIIKQKPRILIALYNSSTRSRTLKTKKNKSLYNLRHYDYPIMKALIWNNYSYIKTLNRDDMNNLFKKFDYSLILREDPKYGYQILDRLIELKAPNVREFYKNWIFNESESFLKKMLINNEIPFFLDLYSILNSPIHIYQPNVFQGRPPPLSPCITIVNKRIVNLNLRGCVLDKIPDSIGKLTNLKRIDLLKNALKSLPASMSNLKLLKELELSDNQFDEFPSVISQLKSLEKLRLEKNFIEEVPETIFELNSINFFDLSKNNLKILPNSISSLKNLELLDLNHNNLESINSISGLKNLELLNLSFNNLESVPENINKLESLKILLCDYNNLKDLPNSIGNLMKLKELHIDGNPITSLPESILKMCSLEIFSINPECMDETAHSILDILSNNNINICSPPYIISLDLKTEPTCIRPKNLNTRYKYSFYVKPERLPLTLNIIDKLDELYKMVYNLRKDLITPKLCNTIFETFKEIKNQLNPNFSVILDESFKNLLLEVLNS
ncbi:MAG: leucine-rich repeat domain-containing protein [Promethearchaeota archaeon]|nr:MAG: leucine-rich repeat domain-containing protein [Candidatus Lokiarchaeota archaeon]